MQACGMVGYVGVATSSLIGMVGLGQISKFLVKETVDTFNRVENHLGWGCQISHAMSSELQQLAQIIGGLFGFAGGAILCGDRLSHNQIESLKRLNEIFQISGQYALIFGLFWGLFKLR